MAHKKHKNLTYLAAPFVLQANTSVRLIDCSESTGTLTNAVLGLPGYSTGDLLVFGTAGHITNLCAERNRDILMAIGDRCPLTTSYKLQQALAASPAGPWNVSVVDVRASHILVTPSFSHLKMKDIAALYGLPQYHTLDAVRSIPPPAVVTNCVQALQTAVLRHGRWNKPQNTEADVEKHIEAMLGPILDIFQCTQHSEHKLEGQASGRVEISVAKAGMTFKVIKVKKVALDDKARAQALGELATLVARARGDQEVFVALTCMREWEFYSAARNSFQPSQWLFPVRARNVDQPSLAAGGPAGVLPLPAVNPGADVVWAGDVDETVRYTQWTVQQSPQLIEILSYLYGIIQRCTTICSVPRGVVVNAPPGNTTMRICTMSGHNVPPSTPIYLHVLPQPTGVVATTRVVPDPQTQIVAFPTPTPPQISAVFIGNKVLYCT
eukprot:TRINITY_DN1101_c0_g1_i1.p1 TRINITY_DN1101_c0_g1~~TRINITY_DN1101_c0_g1_i1.p1  ORF type:complete len:448 (-),score=34.02 TRINITY_DN1101_c0_g1_i1:37-1350(-)